jgi:RNA polymerase sigma-70 factor (ECF subfamily)
MTETDTRSDEALLQATCREPAAFAVFYRRYARAVLGCAMRRLADAELAADVTSEVFAAALEASDRFDPSRGSARGWLFGIVANQVGSAARRRGADTRARRRLGMEPVALADDQRAWVEALALEQDALLVRQALTELSASERMVLELRVIDGRTYQQLAEELGVSEPAVRKRVSRGLAALRLRFQQGEVAS